MTFTSETASHQSLFGDRIEPAREKYAVTVRKNEERIKTLLSISRKGAGLSENQPFRFRLGVRDVKTEEFKTWQNADDLVMHLGKMYSDPRAYKWIIPE